jgi:hypothetical protein
MRSRIKTISFWEYTDPKQPYKGEHVDIETFEVPQAWKAVIANRNWLVLNRRSLCPFCDGLGYIKSGVCQGCKGSGELSSNIWRRKT